MHLGNYSVEDWRVNEERSSFYSLLCDPYTVMHSRFSTLEPCRFQSFVNLFLYVENELPNLSVYGKWGLQHSVLLSAMLFVNFCSCITVSSERCYE